MLAQKAVHCEVSISYPPSIQQDAEYYIRNTKLMLTVLLLGSPHYKPWYPNRKNVMTQSGIQ